MPGATEYTVVDGQGREVAVRVDEGREVAADAGGGSEVVVQRIGGEHVRKGVPIGTRHSKELQLRVNGETLPLSVGAGRLSRRSFRVRFTGVDGADYGFVPVTDDESALSRGGVELARYFVNGDDRIEFFQDGSQSPTATESAAAVAFSGAFGCGAMHGFGVFAEILVNGGTQA